LSLSEPTLDDRRFQDLVDEARGRIARHCPEWTEHNVSDPGITLIETFAWMTEMLSYRLNRVPSRLHVALLALLGIELAPPSAAEVDLRLLLAAPAERQVVIAARATEVSTVLPADDPVVFHVRDDFTIEPVRPAAFVVQQADARAEVHDADAGTASPEQPAYSTPPQVGEAIYLGFDHPLDRLVVRVRVECTRARGVGIRPDSPPLVWEVSQGAGWTRAEVLADTTGGFNEGSGAVDLQMPEQTSATVLAKRQLHWLRCRVDRLTPGGLGGPRYTHPPRIHSITAHAIGALLPAEHAEIELNEELGTSDGTAGQVFSLRHSPAVELRGDETLEVLEPGADGWEPWEQRDSFDDSDREDRHYRFDAATGEIELGPAIRQRRRAWRQYGAIPAKDSRLRMTRYRHGGGERGDVARGTLRRLRKPIAEVASVTNPEAAEGGVDVETVAAARRRAALELRTRYRAVTAEDFEFLAGEAPVKIGRAHCHPPAPGEAIPVYVLPPVVHPDRRLTFEELRPSTRVLKGVAEFLDGRRLMGTRLHVMPVPLRCVTVVVDVTVSRAAQPERVEQCVKEALYRFVNPLVGGSIEGPGEGWAFGRPLNEGDIYSLVLEVDEVEHVRTVRMYETDPRTPDSPSPQPSGSRIVLAPNEVLCSGTHRVRGQRDAN
jgi:predicted phage baseplate assembly protein